MFGAGSVTGRSKFVRPAAVACSRSLRLLCNEPCKHRLFLRAQTSGCSGSVGCVRGARAYLGPLFCTSLSRVRHTYQHHPFYEHTLEYPKIDRRARRAAQAAGARSRSAANTSLQALTAATAMAAAKANNAAGAAGSSATPRALLRRGNQRRGAARAHAHGPVSPGKATLGRATRPKAEREEARSSESGTRAMRRRLKR